jgi:phosphodiesterase/alkaline phosphatase D-like protein
MPTRWLLSGTGATDVVLTMCALVGWQLDAHRRFETRQTLDLGVLSGDVNSRFVAAYVRPKVVSLDS